MRRHFEFEDGTTWSATYKKGDMSALATLADADAQLEHFPEVLDHAGGRNQTRIRYVNPLVKTWDTER